MQLRGESELNQDERLPDGADDVEALAAASAYLFGFRG
jgi:hypothetical protein